MITEEEQQERCPIQQLMDYVDRKHIKLIDLERIYDAQVQVPDIHYNPAYSHDSGSLVGDFPNLHYNSHHS